MKRNFDTKDIGLVDVILGIKIVIDHQGITLTQSHCGKKVLKKVCSFDCEPVKTPLDPQCTFERAHG